MTVVVDTETRRVLILDANGNISGAIDCTKVDCPVDVITDVCVSEGRVYLSGCILELDANMVIDERVVAYDRHGTLQGIVYEDGGVLLSVPLIKQICDAPGGIVISRIDYDIHETEDIPDELAESIDGEQVVEGTSTEVTGLMKFIFANESESRELRTIDQTFLELYDMAYDADGEGHYVTLDGFGMLGDGKDRFDSRIYKGHVFTSVDIDGEGAIYACDDVTGSLCAIFADAAETRVLVPGSGYDNVSENHGVISLCDIDSNMVVLCDTAGAVTNRISSVRPNLGFSIHMLLVWISGLYLVGLALVLAVREVRRRIKTGDTEGFGPMFMSVAVVLALAVAIANLTYASYERSLEIRTNEIQMCSMFLGTVAPELTESMEKANDREALRSSGGDDSEVLTALRKTAEPVLSLAMSGSFNGIGLYYSLPRLASNREDALAAAREVKRTDTSAAALGTVLGGYAAFGLGNAWVYAIVAIACLPIILMALNLLPKDIGPLERLAQSTRADGRIRDFVKSPIALGLGLCVIFPAILASGYASFLFPVFSADLGVSSADINNIYVLGQLIVFSSISWIERIEARFGYWRTVTLTILLMGVVFLLFAVKTQLAWAVAVIAIVGLLCKFGEGARNLWIQSARGADVPIGHAVSALFATRSLARMAQPFVLAALLGVADNVAVIIIGVFCLICALVFSYIARDKLWGTSSATSVAANPSAGKTA